ncbi:MAG: hypothetical protein AAGG11_02005 [Pseudomonadota bacterium]
MPSPKLARRLTGLAVLLFASPLAALLLLAAILDGFSPGPVALVLGVAAVLWMLLLRCLKPWVETRLLGFESELPRLMLVREQTDAPAGSRI